MKSCPLFALLTMSVWLRFKGVLSDTLAQAQSLL